MKPPKTPKKSRVTKLAVARLYSVGNYEHVRFEITAEVPAGGSAKQTLLDLGAILSGLKPIKVPYQYSAAKEAIKKVPEARSEYEKANLETFQDVVRSVEAARTLRLEALAKLDDVGGASTHTDAKSTWDDEDCPW